MITTKKIYGVSQKGIRENNEDYILFENDTVSKNRVLVLCDGMGGHGHGEVASSVVANSVFSYLNELGDDNFEANDLQNALNCALAALSEADVYDDSKKMGTTLVVVVFNKMNILVGHVGDSRCYQFDKNGLIKFRTKDHTKVAEAVEAEIITEEEALESPLRNLLSRCVIAGADKVKIDVDKLIVDDGDSLMMCSDGVTDAMSDDDLQSLFIDRELSEIARCIEDTCSTSSHDNYSFIITNLGQDESNTKEQAEIGDQHTHMNLKDAEIDEIYCPNCGTPNHSEDVFCKSCGKKLIAEDPEKDDFNNKDINVNKNWQNLINKCLPYICICGGLLLGFIIGRCSNSIDETTLAPKGHNKHIELNNSTIERICEICNQETDSIIEKSKIMNEINKIKTNF